MFFSMQPIPQPILLMEQIRLTSWYLLNIPLFTGIPKHPNGGKRRISEPSTVSHPIHPPNLDASKFWEVFQVELKTGSFNVFRIFAAVDVLKRATAMDPCFFSASVVFFGVLIWKEMRSYSSKIRDALGDALPLVQNIFKLLESIGFNINDTTSSRSWFMMNLHICNLKSTPKNGPASSVRALFQQISIVWGPCWPAQCMPGSARVGPWGCQLCSLDLEVVGNPLTHMVQPQIFKSHPFTCCNDTWRIIPGIVSG